MMHNTAHSMATYSISNGMSPNSSESMNSPSPTSPQHQDSLAGINDGTLTTPSPPYGAHSNSNVQFKNYTVTNPPGNQDTSGITSSSSSVGILAGGMLEPYRNPAATTSDEKIIKLSQQSIQGPIPSISNSANYQTPNHTPTPICTPKQTISSSKSPKSAVKHEPLLAKEASKSSIRRKSVTKESLKNALSDFFPANIQRDANGFPILSRDFVVRRISEGETGRLKEELKCEACGKGYKHITSLAKHLWEHTAEWQTTKKLLISKHQQAQLLEAASILCSIGEKDGGNSTPETDVNQNQNQNQNGLMSDTPSPPTNNDSNSTTANVHALYPTNKNHIIPNQSMSVSNTIRRKSKSENSKAGKFGGKRRSKSFAVPTTTPVALTPATKVITGTQIHSHSHPHTQSHDIDSSSVTPFSSMRRGSASVLPPSDLRRPSTNLGGFRPSISMSCSRRGSLLGSLIKEEDHNEDSVVIYDSEEE